MNGVENWALNQSLHREHEVDKIKEEITIVNEEGKRDPVILKFYCFISKVVDYFVFCALLSEYLR